MILKLYNLSYKCPKGKVREAGCPFNVIDHLSFKEKIDWIDHLSEKQKEDILEYHQSCTRAVSMNINAFG